MRHAIKAGAARAGGAIELYVPWPTFESERLERLGPVTLAPLAPVARCGRDRRGLAPAWNTHAARRAHVTRRVEIVTFPRMRSHGTYNDSAT